MYPDCPRLHPSRLRHVEIVLEEVTDLSPIGLFSGLLSLALVNCGIAALEGLETLRLRELRLDENRIEDVSLLASQGQLTALYLSNNLISDLAPLSPLTQL